jgi:two-component system response regulator HydG
VNAEGKASILIVDDNISLARTTALILGRKGYAVDMAQDGPTAIEKALHTPFDVALMDIKMPLMNGVETYKRIKAICPGTAVIMMTAYAVEDLVAEALQEGAYAVIYKPLDMERTLELVERARQERRGALVQVVDDDPGTCLTLRKVLEHKGYSVAIAPDGETAIAQARERCYDVILIDMKLPTINGLETYLAIKEINPEAVAIIMTGYRQEVSDLVEETLRNGAYICLYKPLDIEELLELLEEIWERKQTRMRDKERG